MHEIAPFKVLEAIKSQFGDIPELRQRPERGMKTVLADYQPEGYVRFDTLINIATNPLLNLLQESLPEGNQDIAFGASSVEYFLLDQKRKLWVSRMRMGFGGENGQTSQDTMVTYKGVDRMTTYTIEPEQDSYSAKIDIILNSHKDDSEANGPSASLTIQPDGKRSLFIGSEFLGKYDQRRKFIEDYHQEDLKNGVSFLDLLTRYTVPVRFDLDPHAHNITLPWGELKGNQIYMINYEVPFTNNRLGYIYTVTQEHNLLKAKRENKVSSSITEAHFFDHTYIDLLAHSMKGDIHEWTTISQQFPAHLL